MRLFGSKRLRRSIRRSGKRGRVNFDVNSSTAAVLSSDENADDSDDFLRNDGAKSSDFRQELLTWIIVYLTVFFLHVSYDIVPYSAFLDQVLIREGKTQLASWFFNLYPITYVITGFLLAKWVTRYDSGRVLLFGTLVAGIASCLYGFVGYLKSLTAFLTYHLILQTVEAAGSATANLAGSVILVNMFKNHINKLEGLFVVVQTSAALAAPEIGKRLYKLNDRTPIGGVYTVGGGVLANGLCGLSLLIICLIGYKFLPEAPGKERLDDRPGWLSMLKVPWLYIVVLINFVHLTASMAFDVKMMPWFVKHGFKIGKIENLLKMQAVVTMAAAVVFGFLADFKRAPIPLFLILGLVLGGETFFLVGPSPLFPIKLKKSDLYTLTATGVYLSGVFCMMSTIPTFAILMHRLRNTGIPSLATISMITAITSGINKFCEAFGWKINEKLSAKLGLGWHTTVVGFCLSGTALIVLLAYIVEYCLNRAKKEDPVEETKPILPEKSLKTGHLDAAQYHMSGTLHTEG